MSRSIWKKCWEAIPQLPWEKRGLGRSREEKEHWPGKMWGKMIKGLFLLGYELNVFGIFKESPVQIWIVFPFTFSCQSRKVHRNENKIIKVTYDFTTRNELFSFVMFLCRFVFNTHLIFKQNVITFYIQFHNLSDAQYLGCCYHMNVIIKGLCGVLKTEGTTRRAKDCDEYHGISG